MSRALPLIVILVSLAACTSPGVLVGALDDTDFASDESTEWIVARREANSNSYEIRTLNGELVRPIATGGFRIVDIDNRAERFVAQGYVGNGYGYLAGSVAGDRRPLPEGSEWYGAAIDPQGARIAVTSNTRRLIRVMSFDDFEVLQEIPCPQSAYCYWVAWDSNEADILWLGSQAQDGYARLNLHTGNVVSVSRNEFPGSIRFGFDVMLHNSDRCPESGATLATNDAGIEMRGTSGPRTIVTIEGYRHSRFPAIGRAAFIANCRYVVFDFGGSDWLVDVDSGSIGRVRGYAVYSL